MANVHTSSLAVYRLEMLERICKTMAQLRLSEEGEVGDREALALEAEKRGVGVRG